MVELRPVPFGALVRRAVRELERHDAVFDLPRRRFFTGSGARDYSARFHGLAAGTPLGPAAGPQSQMAQNVALAWLGGSRIVELKTVQVNDELVLPRPCIDMQREGYNVEWSQELRLEQSLEEYVKGAMLVTILAHLPAVGADPASAATLYDMSVGYDLAGIRSQRVRAFLDGMRDCTALVERLRAAIPSEHAWMRELPFPTRLSDTLTLSTFHGCPPGEIERICEHLLVEHGLHTIVKLNPMLLGPELVRGILCDELGYGEVRVPDSAFERDARWDEAAAFCERLAARADGLGLGFGVKLTNTLIVENHRDFFPSDQREMYLSGPPLHVLAMQLVGRFRATFGERLPISFSAGVERRNFPDAVALGLVPITVCSDWLKPGGYARAKGFLDELGERMDAVGARDVASFVERAYGPDGGGVLANTEHYVRAVRRDERYTRAANEKVPRKIGRSLVLFDCITCDKCVPVCPNDANFVLPLAPREVPRVELAVVDGRFEVRATGRALALAEKHQLATFADLCNECGNCDVFCPEDGGPYLVKPLFFGTLDDWRRFAPRDGFHVGPGAVHGRIEGREVSLERLPSGRSAFCGAGFRLELDERDPTRDPRGEADAPVDLAPFHVLRWLRDAIESGERATWLAPQKPVPPVAS